jgi:hypothetical protein
LLGRIDRDIAVHIQGRRGQDRRRAYCEMLTCDNGSIDAHA